MPRSFVLLRVHNRPFQDEGGIRMAQHGYLREFDEGWDRGDDRDWRDRESGWRGERDFRDRDADRDRNFMFDSRERSERDWRGGYGRDWEHARRDFGSSQDEHYRSWRDRQMEALDRAYAEYCSEREQQFHQDFDSWRRQRRANPQPLQTGVAQSGQTQEPADTLELTKEVTADPMGAATLGTTSSKTGRRG